jgi:hypothetical protein
MGKVLCGCKFSASWVNSNGHYCWTVGSECFVLFWMVLLTTKGLSKGLPYFIFPPAMNVVRVFIFLLASGVIGGLDFLHFNRYVSF